MNTERRIFASVEGLGTIRLHEGFVGPMAGDVPGVWGNIFANMLRCMPVTEVTVEDENGRWTIREGHRPRPPWVEAFFDGFQGGLGNDRLPRWTLDPDEVARRAQPEFLEILWSLDDIPYPVPPTVISGWVPAERPMLEVQLIDPWKVVAWARWQAFGRPLRLVGVVLDGDFAVFRGDRVEGKGKMAIEYASALVLCEAAALLSPEHIEMAADAAYRL